MDTLIAGLLLVTLAGLGTGTTAWPMQRIKNLHLETFLFVSMATAIVIVPWSVTLLSVNSPVEVLKEIGIRPLLVSNALSIGWGIANVLYYICVIRIGSALTGAILSALGMSFGMILPMLVKGSGSFNDAPDLFSKTGILILSGLFIMLLGGTIITIAGFEREKFLKANQTSATAVSSGSFLQGLILVILAGILSSGLSLSFVYGQAVIIDAVVNSGNSDITANFAVWAFGMLGGGLVNIIYTGYLMSKRKTWKMLFSNNGETFYGVIMGFQFILSIVFLGKGMLLLGSLGASVGFGIQQSMQVVGNQLVGFIRGEWRSVTGKPFFLLCAGLLTILTAIVILAYSNTSGAS